MSTSAENAKAGQGVRRFEDLVAWQRARELSRRVYDVTRDGAFSRGFGLRDQIRRAAVSAMSNVAEGFERNRSREFHQYLSVAKASAAEVRSLLVIAHDVGYLPDDQYRELYLLVQEVGRILGGLRKSVVRNSTQHFQLSTQHSSQDLP